MTNTKHTREEKLFRHSPIWKSVLIMAMPSMILMLVFGSYFFFDSVLSINLANDSYEPGFLSSTDQVRLFMNGYSPINALMMAIALLFSMGISTRVSINLGAGRRKRALRTIKSGTMISLSLSLVMIVVLLFSAKPWIASQYDSSINLLVADESFKYAWPIIISFPIVIFNQIISSLLRVEARNKQMLIALVTPIFFNLFGDWLFMGPIGMGVEGGAWSTFISTVLTTILLMIFIIKTPKSIITFKNLFGLRFKVISIVGIILVGISPFLRNIAGSITSTTQMTIVKDISRVVYASGLDPGSLKLTDAGLIEIFSGLIKNKNILPTDALADWNKLLAAAHIKDPSSFEDVKKLVHVYNSGSYPNLAEFLTQFNQQAKEANYMTIVITGAIPIFTLFFPVMFSFSQAGRPIAAYNYGAKDFKRVKETYWWTTFYASIAAILIYLLVAFGISGPLMNILQVKGQAYGTAKTVLKIIMLSLIAFSFAISGMMILGSTDRVLLSIIASLLQGVILYFPIIFGMKEVAINHPSYQYWLWWSWPIINITASIVITAITSFIILRLDKKKHITLDERINKIDNWIMERLKNNR